ncbi:hypothetical protein B7463_g11531, partial [Scytalidium lignicola]
MLNEQEEELREESDKDNAHIARTSQHNSSSCRNRSRLTESGGSRPDLKCYLCKGNHYFRNCKHLDLAGKLLRKHLREKKEKKAVRLRENSFDKDKHSNTKSSSKPSSKKSTPKQYGYRATTKSDTDLSSSSDISDSTTDSDPEQLEVTETCHLSKEELSKAIPQSWPSDTGVSSYMSDQPSIFKHMIPIKRRRIKVGGGEMFAEYKGLAELKCDDGSSMLLQDVLYVPDLGVNLLFARRLCQAGLKGLFNATKMYFMNGNKKIVTATMKNGLYIVLHVSKGYEETAFPSVELDEKTTEIQTHANDNQTNEPELKDTEKERYLLFHRRFAYLGPKKIRNLHKVTTLETLIKVPRKRKICEFDVARPFPQSLRGNKYFLLIIDNFTRKNWVLPLSNKSDAQGELEVWKTVVELQAETKIKVARSDNAPELLQVIEGWRINQGVESQPTTIASSYQNGLAEQNINTVEADMRVMLKEADLPLEFWDEAIEADVYLRNRTDTGPVINGKTVSPEEAWTGVTPSIDHIRFKVYSPELGYIAWLSRIIVDENTKGGTVDLRIRNCEAGSQGTPNTMSDCKPRGRPKKDANTETILTKATLDNLPRLKTTPQVIIPPFTPPPNVPAFTEEDFPMETDKVAREPKPLVKDTTEQIPNNQTLELILLDTKLTSAQEEISTLGLPTKESTTAFVVPVEAEEIRILGTRRRTILKDYAMAEELLSLHINGTWEEVISLKGANLVLCKWVYAVKTNVDGTIERFKACLVARGFSQVHGEDYLKTFALTVRMDTLRLFLAIVVAENLECYQYDIKNAFTESHLKEKIYLAAPPGVPVKRGYALYALRSLYGLKFSITTGKHKTKKIPAADYESLRPATDDDTRINVREYQQGIGSILFTMIFTRPDIAFVIGKLSQFISDPVKHHGHALKNLMRYLRSTIKLRLRYSPGGVYKHFVVYSDADWANDKHDRKSISGNIVMFYNGPISWSSKKQKENANLVQMLGDNQGAIALTKNLHLHERSKHIDICYHYIRDLGEKGRLRVDFVPTTEMIADGFTKPLQRVAFERFKNQIGLSDRPLSN